MGEISNCYIFRVSSLERYINLVALSDFIVGRHAITVPPPPSHTAQGNLKPEVAGLVAGLASKATKLRHGTGADDIPVVSVESDAG